MSAFQIPLAPLPPAAGAISGDLVSLPAWHSPIPGSFWFDQVGAAAIPPNGSANAVVVAAQTIPSGYSAIVKRLANIAQYGGFVDASGWLIWQILIDDYAVNNYQAITAQLALINNPAETFIEVPGGSTVSWVVQSAVQAPPGGAQTVCRLSGWYWPVSMQG